MSIEAKKSRGNGYKKKPSQPCANGCGSTVSNAGGQSSSGLRWCMKPECRAAKARYDYRRRNPARSTENDAPTKCSSCGKDLTPRPKRAGDEMGRWCRNASCRADRQRTRSLAGVEEIAKLRRELEVTSNRAELLAAAVLADDPDNLNERRLHCRECGHTSALRGWGHATSSGEPCAGTLDGAPVRNFGLLGLAQAWPSPVRYDMD
jgi:hypothetical protein